MSHAEDAFDATLDIPEIGSIQFDARSRAEVEFLIDEIFRAGEYTGHDLVYSPGHVIVDVGANIGLFALDAVRRCEGQAKLIAIEPMPQNLRHLRKNLGANAHIVEAGLTKLGGPTKAVFTHFPGLPANSTMFGEEKLEELAAHTEAYLAKLKRENEVVYFLTKDEVRGRLERLRTREEIEVPLTTLTEIRKRFALERIDLLKIDVEGAELDVLGGLDAETWEAVQQIVLETTEARMDTIGEWLSNEGFDVDAEVPKFAQALGSHQRQMFARR